MDKNHSDEVIKNSAEEKETASKSPGNLDSPQFQEVVRGFMAEKELLEKRHKDEIEELKVTFSKKGNVLSESNGARDSCELSGSNEFSHSGNAMVGQSTQMVMNGTRCHETVGTSSAYQDNEAYNGRQFQDSSLSGGYASTSKDFSTGLPTSHHGQYSGQLSPMRSSTATSGRHDMVNGFVGHSNQVGGEFEMINGGVSQHQNTSLYRGTTYGGVAQHYNTTSHQGNSYGRNDYNGITGSHIGASLSGTLHQPINGHHSFLTKDTAIGLHGTSSGNHPNGVYHASGMKNSHHSSAWNPTFYPHNLFPPRGDTGVQSSSGSDVYGVSLELMNGPSMRVNTDNLASQIRPDLDLEDRLEQQREFLQQRFAEEKRQLRKMVQEEFTRKFEVEKRKQEEVIQSLKKANFELEYQKKEVEVKIRHERESLQLRFESQRTEYERKCRKQSEEHRSKSTTKYEAEMTQQKETYEGIIEKQKNDIQSLTLQLEELNENLKREKDNVVAAFEKEVEEFKERMRVEKEKSDSELVVKLKSEISLLTSVNKSLREEIDNKEREKQELEILMKEERSRTELNYENQISKIEAHFEAEKQTLSLQYEEKVAVLVKEEKFAIEENSQKSSEELEALKRENETLREVVENSYNMEQEATQERDELLQNLLDEKELLGARIRELVSKQQFSPDTPSREDYDRFMLNANNELKESQDYSAKIQRDLKHVLEEREALLCKVEGLMQVIDELKKEKLNVNAEKDEKAKLLNEVSRLNEEVDKMFEDIQEKGRKEVLLKEKLNKVEESLHRQESENTQLKLEKMENQNKLAVFERQLDDLRNDLSTIRRRKVELDEENCNLKKEKSDSDGKIAVLQTTNDSLLQELQKAKQRISQLEQEVTALTLEKLELQQQLRLIKMQQSNYQEVRQGLNAISDTDSSGSALTSADETKETTERDHASRAKRKSGLEKQICKLKREKAEYEMSVERLKRDIESLEREALKQIEHNKAISEEFVSARKEFEKQMNDLKRQREALEVSIVHLQNQERGIRNDMTSLDKQKAELEHSVGLLRAEEERRRQASETETKRISEDHETKYQQLQRRILGLESTKRELQGEIESLERDEATLRCSIEELQQESHSLSQRITQMKESVRDARKKRVSWVDSEVSDEASSLGFNDVMEEITKLRRERDALIRSISELERKQTELDISVESANKNHQICQREVDALSRKRSELESAICSLKTEKFELETGVHELSATNVENATNAQRKEIEMLRSELAITRESCEDIRSMYHEVQCKGNSKVEVVETELRLAEDNLMRLKRERLELEKIISTLLRRKTELESEVAMIVDSKYREDRDTSALREERLNLDTELVRLRSQITELRSTLSNLEDAKTVTEHELRSLDARKERVNSYVSGMEARLLIGQASPVSWNIAPPKEYILTPRDDLEKQVLQLREEKLSLEADLFKLRRKSGDGVDTRSCGYYSEGALWASRVNMGYIGVTGDHSGQCVHSQNRGLQQDIEGLAKQKSKLSSEVQEMQVKKTDLDTQITNLESRKLGLEQSGRLFYRRENESSEINNEGKLDSHEEYSVNMEFFNYSVEQMQELRQKNSDLENKLSVLESHLHDAKYEMEKQTLEYQKELKIVQNSLISQQQSESGQQQQLSVIVDRLRNFIEESKLTETDQLYEEIKDEIKALNRKVEVNSEKMKDIYERNWKTTGHLSEMKETAHTVDEISGHIQDAEINMERYNEIVSHLQRENEELLEVVSRLEERLTAAGKSHELLQRKKVILQDLLETVSAKTGEDLIEQSNMIFELDKDVSL